MNGEKREGHESFFRDTVRKLQLSCGRLNYPFRETAHKLMKISILMSGDKFEPISADTENVVTPGVCFFRHDSSFCGQGSEVCAGIVALFPSLCKTRQAESRGCVRRAF